MEKILKTLAFTLLAVGILACGGCEKKLTQDDLKDAHDTLFNADRTLNEKKAPDVAKKYCQYVKQNPNDTSAVKWLYHAMEINVMLKNADKSIELCDQLLQQLVAKLFTFVNILQHNVDFHGMIKPFDY